MTPHSPFISPDYGKQQGVREISLLNMLPSSSVMHGGVAGAIEAQP